MLACPSTGEGVMDDRVESMSQQVEDRAWTTLRALAQEHGMTDPCDLADLYQQLLWMGIKAGSAATLELVRGVG